MRRLQSVAPALLVLCAGLNVAVPNPALALAPDYLLLAFLADALYHEARLTFFDALVKRGAFFATGLIALSVLEPWRRALLLMPFWLAAPWIYGRMARAIDRVWLHRRYTPADAERRFVGGLQGGARAEGRGGG